MASQRADSGLAGRWTVRWDFRIGGLLEHGLSDGPMEVFQHFVRKIDYPKAEDIMCWQMICLGMEGIGHRVKGRKEAGSAAV